MPNETTRRDVLCRGATGLAAAGLAGVGSAAGGDQSYVCPALALKIDLYATGPNARYRFWVDAPAECQSKGDNTEWTDTIASDSGGTVVEGTEPEGGLDTYRLTAEPEIDWAYTQNIDAQYERITYDVDPQYDSV